MPPIVRLVLIPAVRSIPELALCAIVQPLFEPDENDREPRGDQREHGLQTEEVCVDFDGPVGRGMHSMGTDRPVEAGF